MFIIFLNKGWIDLLLALIQINKHQFQFGWLPNAATHFVNNSLWGVFKLEFYHVNILWKNKV